MSQRFGYFFLDPQWPSNCQQNNPHLANLHYEDQQEGNLYKPAQVEPQVLKLEYGIEGYYCLQAQNQIKNEQFYESQCISQQSNILLHETIQSQRLQQKIKQEQEQEREQIEQRQRQSLAKQKGHEKYIKKEKKKKRKQYQRGRYKILSEQLKKVIVQQSKAKTMVEVAKKYHVSVNNICRWRKRCDRRLGAGRKVTDMEMQCRLLDWLMKQKHPIPRKQVQIMAKRLSKQRDFKASKGWFERFYKRNRLCYNPNIQILTYNDYRQRINQVIEQKQRNQVAELEEQSCQKQVVKQEE